jgi:hypothetical protein
MADGLRELFNCVARSMMPQQQQQQPYPQYQPPLQYMPRLGTIGPPPLLNVLPVRDTAKEIAKEEEDKKKIITDSKVKHVKIEISNFSKYLEDNRYRRLINEVPEITALQYALVPRTLVSSPKCKNLMVVTQDKNGLFAADSVNGWTITEVYDDETVLIEKIVKENYVAEPINKEYIDELVAYQKRNEELKIALSSNVKATEEATKSNDADLNLIGALCLENKKLRNELDKPFIYKNQKYPKSTVLSAWSKSLRVKIGMHFIDNLLIWILKAEHIDTSASKEVKTKAIVCPEAARLTHPGSSKNDFVSFIQRIQVGDFIDALDGPAFYPSVVTKIENTPNKKIARIEIHYLGWASAYDRWIEVSTTTPEEVKTLQSKIDRAFSQCSEECWQHWIFKLTAAEKNLYQSQIEQLQLPNCDPLSYQMAIPQPSHILLRPAAPPPPGPVPGGPGAAAAGAEPPLEDREDDFEN